MPKNSTSNRARIATFKYSLFKNVFPNPVIFSRCNFLRHQYSGSQSKFYFPHYTYINLTNIDHNL